MSGAGGQGDEDRGAGQHAAGEVGVAEVTEDHRGGDDSGGEPGGDPGARVAPCYDVRADGDRGGEKELVGQEAGEGAEQAGE